MFGLKVVEFQAGESEKTVDFTLLERSEGHPNTRFTVKMLRALHSPVDENAVVVNITSNKALQAGEVGFAAAEASATEGVPVTLTLSRTNGTDGDATFNVSTENGTAIAGVDYQALNQAVTIKGGETTATVVLNSTKRIGKQGARTVVLNITGAEGAALGTSRMTVTLNDAAEPGVVSFDSSTANVSEAGSVTLNITRANGSDGAVSVNVSTLSGSAVAGTDFTAIDRVVNFAEGQTSASVTINALNRSGTQGARTFTVQISGATGGVEIGSVATATVSIADAAPQAEQGGGSSGGSMSAWLALPLMILIAARSKLAAK